MMSKSLIRNVTWLMAFAMCVIGFVPRVEAGMVPSQPLSSNRGDDLARIQQTLETKMVSESLKQMGFTREEVSLKLNQMDDQQIHQLASKIDEVRVGGDALGVVIALLVIAILVVLLLQLTGHKIFIK